MECVGAGGGHVYVARKLVLNAMKHAAEKLVSNIVSMYCMSRHHVRCGRGAVKDMLYLHDI